MSEMMDKMLDAVEEAEESQLTEEEVRFMVDDDQKAEWCIRKIAEEKAELEKFLDWYNHQIERAKKRAENRIAFFEEKLKPYFASVPKKETKTQLSYQLPSGKLVLKRQGPEFEKDEGTVLDWLDRQPDGKNYIKIKETLDWSGLKNVLTIAGGRMVTEDGEIVPGITVMERPDVFKVEVK